jgi:WD40 repeat protein
VFQPKRQIQEDHSIESLLMSFLHLFVYLISLCARFPDVPGDAPPSTRRQLRDVHSLHFTPSGQRAAISTENGNIFIFSPPTLGLVRSFRGLPAPVTQIALTHDGARVSAGCGDSAFGSCDYGSGKWRSVKLKQTSNITAIACCATRAHAIFGCASGLLILPDRYMRRFREFQGHEGIITTVSFHVGTSYFFSAAIDGLVRIWSFARLTLERSTLASPTGVVAAALSPNGGHVLVLTRTTELLLLDWATLAKVATFEGHKPSNHCLQCGFLSNDGEQNLIVFASNADSAIELWENSKKPTYISQTLHQGPLIAVQAHLSHRVIVTGSTEEQPPVVSVWAFVRMSEPGFADAGMSGSVNE